MFCTVKLQSTLSFLILSTGFNIWVFISEWVHYLVGGSVSCPSHVDRSEPETNYHARKECKVAKGLFVPYVSLSSWSVRPNPEDRINRKPDAEKVTKQLNKYKTIGPKKQYNRL